MEMDQKVMSLGDVANLPVDKSGPENDEFIYVDISSVDREAKKIVETKRLLSSEAPSRAKQILKAGDVLVSMTRPNLNAVAIVPVALDGAVGSTGFHVLRSNVVDPKFIYYLVQSKDFIERMCAKVQGALYPAVRPKDIDSYTFNLSSSLEQQREVVAKIEELFSELDNGIKSLKTAREQLKTYRQSLLKHAFEGKLTEQWRKENADKLETPEQLLARIQQEREARYQQQLEEWKLAVKAWEVNGKEGKKPGKTKKPAQIKNVTVQDCVGFPELPLGWSYIRLGMLVDEPTYGTSAKCSYDSGEQSVLRIPNIADGVIDDTDLKFATFEKGEINHLHLEVGDILTIRSNGSISLVGSCALVKEKDVRHIFAGYLIRLRPNRSLILPAFLLAVMSSHSLRKQIELAAKSTSGVNNINTGELQNLIVPLPPLEEQAIITKYLSERVSSIGSVEEELVTQFSKANALRQSILKKAFSGQLFSSKDREDLIT